MTSGRDRGDLDQSVELDDAFAIAERTCNGGYVLCVLHDTARSILFRDPGTSALAVTAHFLAPTPPGSARVRSVAAESGRTLSRVALELHSADRVSVRAEFTFVRTREQQATASPGLVIPRLPDPERCVPIPSVRHDGSSWPLMYRDRVSVLLDPEAAGFLEGRPSGRGEIRAWWDLRDRKPLDAGTLLMALDALPPSTFELEDRNGRTPTVMLTAHLYGDAESLAACAGPLIVRQRVMTANERTADQFCEVWHPAGRPLATAMQINWLLS